jgi:hypothetical protein
MVSINDGLNMHPAQPLAWLATYASNGDEMLIQRENAKVQKWYRLWATNEDLRELVRDSVGALSLINHSSGILELAKPDPNLGEVSMAIVTAKTNEAADVSRDIQDNTFFPVVLLGVNRVQSSEQYKKNKAEGSPPEWRLLYKWNTEDGLDNWIFDATSTSLGESKATVAMLRQLINALHGRKPGSPVAWFNDETLEYGLDAEYVEGATPDGQLLPGLRVQVMGLSTETTVNGERRNKFKVKAYKQADPTSASPAAPATETTPTTAASSVASTVASPTVAAAAAVAPSAASTDEVDF